MHRLGTMDITTWTAGYTMEANKKRKRRSCRRFRGGLRGIAIHDRV